MCDSDSGAPCQGHAHGGHVNDAGRHDVCAYTDALDAGERPRATPGATGPRTDEQRPSGSMTRPGPECPT